jgi:hypothetical protein
MRLRWLLPVALLALGVPPAFAIDHANLDEGRPLRLEDAYTVATGEWALEAGAGFTLQRRGPDRGFFPIEVLYGALPNLQLGLESSLSTDPHAVDEPTKSGDLRLSALYNVNQETLTLPAFGLKLTMNFPTGVDSSGVDVEVKGIVTRSVGRLSLHLNLAYELLHSDDGDERDGRYNVAVGASYPVGAPRYTRTTVLADLFLEQASRRGEDAVVGVEVGFRHQLTPRVVVDAGLGTELAGPVDRSRFFLTAGVSLAF